MITGFTDKFPKGPRKRLILNVEGLEKRGKTHFALTAPDPIAYLDLDTGLEGVVEKFMDEGKRIQFASFNYRDATNYQQWSAMWDKMKTAYLAALASKEIKTLICDTGTEMWELLRLARFGKLSEVMPHHYGPVNAEFRDLLRRSLDSDKNVILLHKLKPKYENNVRTKEFERSGFSDLAFVVQMNVRVARDKDNGFYLTVIDSRHRSELAGEVLSEPMNTFPMLASLVFPDTAVEDWE